jgi:hypothetical protein
MRTTLLSICGLSMVLASCGSPPPEAPPPPAPDAAAAAPAAAAPPAAPVVVPDAAPPAVVAEAPKEPPKPEPPKGSPFPGCEGACNPQGDEAKNAMTGKWKVSGFVFASVSALGPKEAKAHVGKKVDVGPAMNLPWTQCPEAIWTKSEQPVDEWLASWKAPALSKAQRKTLGLGDKPVEVWTGLCAKDGTTITLTATGGKKLVTFWDGVAFALSRAR